MTSYPKRLIEVDLPIKRISEHARREKSIRHGHISTLHIWWARRPLAACRAVICASLWPDPVDELCPQEFRDAAARILCEFAVKVREDSKVAALTGATWKRWNRTTEVNLRGSNPGHWGEIRYALLDFIGEFANWDASTVPVFLETSRALTQAAHEALGGEPGTRPMVADPFAGGGAIPLEALRVGADAFASDLNPVAVLLNKAVLEYIPRYGKQLAEEVRKWGTWIREEAAKELEQFHPKDQDGATPIAYLWARTIRCEGPGCGAEVPLMKSMWLVRKGKRSVAIQILPDRNAKHIDFKLLHDVNPENVGPGTVKRGSATCPVCGYTTPVASVRQQLKAQDGGADKARLLAVVSARQNEQGRFYRLPNKFDLDAVAASSRELQQRQDRYQGELSLVPNEPTPLGGGSGAGRAFSQRHYGMDTFDAFFTRRQALTLSTLVRLSHRASEVLSADLESGFVSAVRVLIALAIDRQTNVLTSFSRWDVARENIQGLFARPAIGLVWDFCEANPFSDSSGNWNGAVEWVEKVCQSVNDSRLPIGQAMLASATVLPYPDDSFSAVITDPPYYDAVPYSDLSDFFFVWLKRTLPKEIAIALFDHELAPKSEECILDEVKGKDRSFYEQTMSRAMSEGRRVLMPSGIGVIVFAHKSTSGWEAQLQAMVDAGWTITGSWPIDTEMGSRLRAMNSAALASSVHLVCRPRENTDGTIKKDIGDWRDVLQELPERIHEWMPRLAREGVVGADAIFACLGPALEIFSRYSRVEKASGEVVPLREYLEHVWGAVAREALGLIFEGADAAAFEPDARLTAMWLWTLTASATGAPVVESTEDESVQEDEDESPKGGSRLAGFELEYDAARKISQGLGIHLEELEDLVQTKGDKARLLPVAERMRHLFDTKTPVTNGVAKLSRKAQLSMFEAMGEVVAEPLMQETGHDATLKTVHTTLDRVHQAMLLFAAGRSDGLRHFLVDSGIGRDRQFWSLAQSLSALYPSATDEKRWVDGVLARKKGLGF